MRKAKNQKRQYANENLIEAKRTEGTVDPTSSAVAELSSDFWEQVLGIRSNNKEHTLPQAGDLSEGQELVLTKRQKELDLRKEKTKDVEPGIDYRGEIVHAEKRASTETNRTIATKIQEILAELKQLMHSSQELKAQFKEIAVEPRIINPGKYHVSFFEWMLLIIKGARMHVEDSNAWLAVFKSKRAKREYWSMFKKHGTTFGLSNERVVATQVG